MEAWFVAFLLNLFLIANLVVGFLKGRDVKTVRDFAVGNRSFSGFALFATFLATMFGGNELYGTTKRLFSTGIIALFGFTVCSIAIYVSGLLMTNQIILFKDCVTLGDFVGKLYGKIAKSFCGLLSGFYCCLESAIQINCLGLVFNSFFQVDFLYAIVFSAIIISLYTAFGGIRAVVATDILQFIIIGATLFSLILFIVVPNGSIIKIIEKIPLRLFSINSLNTEYLVVRTPMLLFLTVICTTPPTFQRLLMAKNRKAAQKMCLYTAIGNMFVGFLLLTIIFFAISVIGDQQISDSNPINTVIKTFVPNKIIPLIGLGFIAIIFSTGDSYLHSAGLCLSKDFLEPILNRNIKLLEVRCITFLSGIVALIVVLWFNSLLNTHIFSFHRPMLAASALYGFLGFKGSSKMFWYSVLFGFLGAFTSNYIPSLQTFKIVIGCFTSLFAYFAVHIYENKGFKVIGNPIFPDRIKKQY